MRPPLEERDTLSIERGERQIFSSCLSGHPNPLPALLSQSHVRSWLVVDVNGGVGNQILMIVRVSH
jgi:hypothetical protein